LISHFLWTGKNMIFLGKRMSFFLVSYFFFYWIIYLLKIAVDALKVYFNLTYILCLIFVSFQKSITQILRCINRIIALVQAGMVYKQRLQSSRLAGPVTESLVTGEAGPSWTSHCLQYLKWRWLQPQSTAPQFSKDKFIPARKVAGWFQKQGITEM
jgi:hypothetical protein